MNWITADAIGLVILCAVLLALFLHERRRVREHKQREGWFRIGIANPDAWITDALIGKTQDGPLYGWNHHEPTVTVVKSAVPMTRSAQSWLDNKDWVGAINILVGRDGSYHVTHSRADAMGKTVKTVLDELSASSVFSRIDSIGAHVHH